MDWDRLIRWWIFVGSSSRRIETKDDNKRLLRLSKNFSFISQGLCPEGRVRRGGFSRILSRLFLADTTTTTTRVYFSLGIASGGQSKNPFINLSVRPLFMLTASPREGRLIRPRVGPQLEVFVCDRLTPFIGTSCCKQMVNTSLESIPFHGQNIVDDGEKLP